MLFRAKLTAAALTLSAAVAFGSVPAFAELTITDGVYYEGGYDDGFISTHPDFPIFAFFDSNLSDMPLGHFATLSMGCNKTNGIQCGYHFWALSPATYDIFDFENSVVRYSDGDSQTLAQIIADSSYVRVYDNIFITWELGWQGQNGREITDISLAYTVPEPETWAMLLAGLGLVTGVTRRRAKMTG